MHAILIATDLPTQTVVIPLADHSPCLYRTLDALGGGHFSSVHRGVWEVPGGSVEVAVKRLKSKASETDKVKFLQEAAIMGQFLHPNVIKLQGVVTIGEPVSQIQ